VLRQTHIEEYAQMSEGAAVNFLLERCNAIDERDAKRAECNARRAARPAAALADGRGAACCAAETFAAAQAEREARREQWRRRREQMLGLVEIEPAVEAALPLMAAEALPLTSSEHSVEDALSLTSAKAAIDIVAGSVTIVDEHAASPTDPTESRGEGARNQHAAAATVIGGDCAKRAREDEIYVQAVEGQRRERDQARYGAVQTARRSAAG
jgi:hypothetical protein